MEDNKALIDRFYTAFAKGDYVTMQHCYADKASFEDPAFGKLNAVEVKAMWEMLISGAKDLRIEFRDVTANSNNGSCRWEAWYTFTATGRSVHNIINAHFTFENDKIVLHRDRFDFWRWSRMALGIPGVLLGWSPFIKNKVRTTARARLASFLKKRQAV